MCFYASKKHGIAEKLNNFSPSNIYISEVTIAELKYGAYKSDRPSENLSAINNFISKINIVSFGETIDIYADTKTKLRKAGKPIEEFDLLIAAAAMSKNLVLVTDNIKHFNHIDNLTIENWVKR